MSAEGEARMFPDDRKAIEGIIDHRYKGTPPDFVRKNWESREPDYLALRNPIEADVEQKASQINAAELGNKVLAWLKREALEERLRDRLSFDLVRVLQQVERYYPESSPGPSWWPKASVLKQVLNPYRQILGSNQEPIYDWERPAGGAAVWKSRSESSAARNGEAEK